MNTITLTRVDSRRLKSNLIYSGVVACATVGTANHRGTVRTEGRATHGLADLALIVVWTKKSRRGYRYENSMWETWEVSKRIAEAKRLTERLVDHTHHLLGICENNAIALYSDQLSKQIPRSYAANAFNVFREALHQIELVRLSALWDQAHIDNEAVPSVIELVDHEDVITALAQAARDQYAKMPEPLDKNEPAEQQEIAARMMKQVNEQRGEEHAQNAIAGLRKAIANGRAMHKSEKLKSIRNLRNKHVAHCLTKTKAERDGEIIAPMKVGDEKPVLETTLSVIQLLYCWVNGVGISFEDARKIDRKCAEELWKSCTFSVSMEADRSAV